MIADLEHGLFARVVTGDGALDAAELCFTAGETRTHICMEGSLQQSMLFVPHKAAFPFHQRGVCAENGILRERGVFAHGVYAVNAQLHRAVDGYTALQKARRGRELHRAVCIDVPAVPPSGDIFTAQELVHRAAAPLHPVRPCDERDDGAAAVETDAQMWCGERIAREDERALPAAGHRRAA